jgi:hypothetical protein
MKTLKEALAKSYWLKLPANQPISVRYVAEKALMKPPISLLGLIKRLDPELVVFSSGKLEADTVTGEAHLAMNSAGFWSFKGYVDEHAAFIGHDWIFAFILMFKDPSGNNMSWKEEGTLWASVEPGGPSRADWQQDGRDILIAENWDVIKKIQFHYELSVGLDLATFISNLFTLGIIAAVVWMIASPKTEASWGRDEKGNPRVDGGLENSTFSKGELTHHAVTCIPISTILNALFDLI